METDRRVGRPFPVRWSGTPSVAALSALAALAVVALLATPASGRAQSDAPKITFRLVLYGEPPEGEQISVGGGSVGSDERVIAGVFCGDQGDPREPEGGCRGGGAEYEESGLFYAGERLSFSYQRVGVARNGTIVDDVRDVGTEDITITAYYDYRTGEGGPGEGPGDQQGGGVPDNQQEGGSPDTGGDSQDGDAGAGDDQQTTPAMPATGAGGRVGSFPLGPLAGGAALAVAGELVARRRR